MGDLRPPRQRGSPNVSALGFLAIAVMVSLLGCLTLWARSRQPTSMDAHIRDFARELDALAPGSPPHDHRRWPRGSGDAEEEGPHPG